MLGEDLVLPLLKASVPDHAEEFFVVAYNPSARGAEGARKENRGKLRHMRLVSEHFGVPQSSALLLDDDDSNHRAHEAAGAGFYSVKVDGRHGLQLRTLVLQAQRLPPGPAFVGLP